MIPREMKLRCEKRKDEKRKEEERRGNGAEIREEERIEKKRR